MTPAVAGKAGDSMRVLILGGYGLIGAALCAAAKAAGHDVIGLGRSAETGRRLVPGVEWIGADMAQLDAPGKWAQHLVGLDAIVNAAGALQDGARDDLDAIHHRSIAALVQAAAEAGVARFVQISAPGARDDASTAFLRTKAAGDAAVRASSLDWIVLKPGLVLGSGAYGGTALLRLLAGLPLMTPLVHAGAEVQTVAIDDVAAAVMAALDGEVASQRDYDLVEEEPHSLREIVRAIRRQIGFAPAKFEPDLPAFFAWPVGVLGDLAGALGWRTPLRSTALKVMGENVRADPSPWREATGRSLKSLDESLAAIQGTAQERIFSRVQLALPVMAVSLALFWIASGVIGLREAESAARLLPGVTPAFAGKAVAAGALADILIGSLLLVRGAARLGAVLSALLALTYLGAGTLIAPQYWADPLGVYVKVIPAIALGVGVALLLEER